MKKKLNRLPALLEEELLTHKAVDNALFRGEFELLEIELNEIECKKPPLPYTQIFMHSQC